MAFVLITNFTSNTFSTEELPMGMLITADDLSRNDYVAIHSLKKRRSSNRHPRVFPGTEAPGSPVPPGYPLRVYSDSVYRSPLAASSNLVGRNLDQWFSIFDVFSSVGYRVISLMQSANFTLQNQKRSSKYFRVFIAN